MGERRTHHALVPLKVGLYRGRPVRRARSSAGEHLLDMEGVTGSIPVAPTTIASPGYARQSRSADCDIVQPPMNRVDLPSANRMSDDGFWQGRRVLVTGHTGFMGGWLVTWLHALGAKVDGLALPPPTTPSFYGSVQLPELLRSEVIADIRDSRKVADALSGLEPEIVFHLAAQPIVSEAFLNPLETFQTNVLGTANLLDAVRTCRSTKAVLVVTSDKVYEPGMEVGGHRESDRLGGAEPYAASKACAELVSSCYRQAYLQGAGIKIATIRAGNILGGGDWAARRLIPDLVRAFSEGRPAIIRSPNAVRPWQHVIEPVRGYLMLAENLWRNPNDGFDDAWNFGPDASDHKAVSWIVERCAKLWGDATWRIEPDDSLAEMPHLALSSDKSRAVLGWSPRINLEAGLTKAIAWYRAYLNGNDVRALSLTQIEESCSTEADTRS